MRNPPSAPISPATCGRGPIPTPCPATETNELMRKSPPESPQLHVGGSSTPLHALGHYEKQSDTAIYALDISYPPNNNIQIQNLCPRQRPLGLRYPKSSSHI